MADFGAHTASIVAGSQFGLQRRLCDASMCAAASAGADTFWKVEKNVEQLGFLRAILVPVLLDPDQACA